MSEFLKMDFYIYEKGAQKDSFIFAGDPFELKDRLISALSDKALYILSTEAEIAFAKIPVDGTDYTIYVGPCRTEPKNNRSAIKSMKFFGLSQSLYTEFNDHFSFLPEFNYSSFAAFVFATYSAINDKIADITGIFKSEKNSKKTISASSFNNKSLSVSLRQKSYEFESKLAFLIENGQVEEILALGDYSYMMTTAAPVAYGTMRQMKNLVEIMITICSRAAMRGGLPPIIAYDLADVFFFRVENAETIEDLFNSTSTLPLAYAYKVREFKSYKTSNLIVRKAVKYVYDNITNKISLKELSENIGVSPTYLSSQFSKELGTTLPMFVKKCRIAYSQYLLSFTETPLAEISDLLHFSSQSAFQNAFKDTVGKTPLEYKAENLA